MYSIREHSEIREGGIVDPLQSGLGELIYHRICGIIIPFLMDHFGFSQLSKIEYLKLY